MIGTIAPRMPGVSVRSMVPADIGTCVGIWNRCRSAPDNLVYKPLTRDAFSSLFSEQSAGVTKINLVAETGGVVAGFANGALKDRGEQGYITIIMVKDEYRRKGIGRSLLGDLEERLSAAAASAEPPWNIDRYEVMFFNPVNLTWAVPGTDGHDHPNAPGVDVSCAGYLFLKNMGYRDIAYQNSYYLRLNGYRYPPDIEKRIESLAAQGLHITTYDSSRHEGLGELFDDLGNEEWRRIVTENVSDRGAGNPVLVVEHGNWVRGFTGPIAVQPSGRGYFAGIGVHSDFRGRGAGKVLFASLCMELKRAGAGFMTLFTGETNPARNIYEAAGFSIVRTWADMRKQI